MKLNLPEQFRQKYLNLLLKNHEAISQDKFDLGRTDTLMHEILLKTQEPIYVKQFKIPDAHRKEVEKHVLEWLKLGIIQPARSHYKSPIFAVMKKDGNVHLVKDFRALYNQSYTDKYSMKDVSECIGEIGQHLVLNHRSHSWLLANDFAPQGTPIHSIHCARHGAISMGHQPYGPPWVPCQLPASYGDCG